jgi:hypothetical protein
MTSHGTSNGAPGTTGVWQQSEASIMHHHVTELANKRISTLDYLRKACVVQQHIPMIAH